MSAQIFIVDIETVPDADAARRLFKQDDLSDLQARDALAAYFLDKTKGRSDFPRQPFHQVVAISYVQLSRERGEQGEELLLHRIGSGGHEESSEAELLQGFFSLIEKQRPQLVTYNGRTFDLPVLKYRAMSKQLSASAWFQTGNRYDSYDKRYSTKYHLDLFDVFSNYGAASCSLDEVAASFAIPDKLDTAGSEVRTLYEQGEIAAIRNYCECDVASTALLFFRWALLTGELSMPAYQRACQGLRHYLIQEAEQRPHFQAFLDAWIDPER